MIEDFVLSSATFAQNAFVEVRLILQRCPSAYFISGPGISPGGPDSTGVKTVQAFLNLFPNQRSNHQSLFLYIDNTNLCFF